MSQTFRCAACSRTFEKGWSDEEAADEFRENFPGEDQGDSALVCDGCYQKLKALGLF